MDCSTSGIPLHHQLPEFTQTHIHWVSDASQPTHPLSSPSPAFNLSQHQGLFKWVSSSHQVAKVLEFQLQVQSFQWTLRTDRPLVWTGGISLQSKGLCFLSAAVPFYWALHAYNTNLISQDSLLQSFIAVLMDWWSWLGNRNKCWMWGQPENLIHSVGLHLPISPIWKLFLKWFHSFSWSIALLWWAGGGGSSNPLLWRINSDVL